jgi:hypothetical protein
MIASFVPFFALVKKVAITCLGDHRDPRKTPTATMNPLLVHTKVAMEIKRLSAPSKPGAMPVLYDTALSKALTTVYNVPAVETIWKRDTTLRIKGKSVGSFLNPKVDAILKAAKSPSGGKGAMEILGEDIELEGEWRDFKSLSSVLGDTLFIGKTFEISLSKLIILKAGVKFDWQEGEGGDATLLLALNTTWQGGGFQLRLGTASA